MEDILASIRRILAEDEPATGATPAEDVVTAPNGGAQAGTTDDVLVLDASMLAPTEPAPVITPPPEALAVAANFAEPITMAVEQAAPLIPVTLSPYVAAEGAPLVIRNTLPCFEDVVREALQPVIQQWLDATLPKMVERLVRTEVERVVGGVA